MSRTFLLISTEAPIDALISWITDFHPRVQENTSWLAGHHRDGDAFVDGVLQSFTVLVEGAAVAAKERAQAVAATESQNAAFVEGRKLSVWVRDQGAYISGELAASDNPKDHLEASRVRVACGVGSRVNTKRQTGLRKQLAIQKKGLIDIAETWVEWKKDPNTAQKLAAAYDRIQTAIEEQANEQVEAQMAQDELEALAKIAVDSANRVLRLVNAAGDETPTKLATGLATLQGQHRDAFWRQGPAEASDDSQVSAEPAEPSEPQTS